MYRHHRLVRQAIAQRAAEVNRLAAQYEEDLRGDRGQSVFAVMGSPRRRRLGTALSGDVSHEGGEAFLPVHVS
jgi:hypothetical protein